MQHDVLTLKYKNRNATFHIPDWIPAIKITNKNMECVTESFKYGKIIELGKIYKTDKTKVCLQESDCHIWGNILTSNVYYEIYDIGVENDKLKIFWNLYKNRYFNVSVRGKIEFDTGKIFSAEHIRIDSEIDMTNGIFTNEDTIIKIYNNQVHCDDGPAIIMNDKEYFVNDGIVTRLRYKNDATLIDIDVSKETKLNYINKYEDHNIWNCTDNTTICLIKTVFMDDFRQNSLPDQDILDNIIPDYYASST